MKPSITVMCDRCGARGTHDDADYVHGRLWCAVCDAWTVHHAVGTLLAGMCDAAQPYWERRECELRRLLEGEGGALSVAADIHVLVEAWWGENQELQELLEQCCSRCQSVPRPRAR